jgi:N6-adenosine-specific RNA methylase IME4
MGATASEGMSDLIQYERACTALADAVTADEVMKVHLSAQTIQAVARVAKNLEMEIAATKLRVRAEGKLGDMLIEAERIGLIASRGGQPKPKNEGSDAEPLSKAKLKDIGVDKKLSADSRRVAGIGQRAVDMMLAKFERESLAGRRLALDIIHAETRSRNAESRRTLARELSDASAMLPGGRRFPVIYADPPWRRKAGIGNRAYENHFPTMTWDDICGLPVETRALPDAWLFLWIPRPHLLARTSMTVDLRGIGPIDIPATLADRVAWSWGFQHYSTCFVWTKTDEDNPDDHGMGLIVLDQDELLLLFKRGRGLPVPDAAEKFGSNFRERPREHSRKPDFYRRMIATMTGGLPVLELFARVDEEHPLPPNWEGWGNQAAATALEAHDPVTGELHSGKVDPARSPLT